MSGMRLLQFQDAVSDTGYFNRGARTTEPENFKMFRKKMIPAIVTAGLLAGPASGSEHGSMDDDGMKDGMGHMKHMGTMKRMPSTLLGAHLVGEGQSMLSYRFMRMDMDGNRDGTDRLSPAEVRSRGFMVVPTEMTMDMHMLMGMYGLNDHVTLMVMGSYISIEMDHVAGMPLGSGAFTTEADGPGDVTAGALWQIWKSGGESVHVNGLVGLPAGSIDEKDDPPGQLPYPMQLGSGTVDLKPGITYTRHLDDWSYGGQVLATIRLDENDRDYTLGDRYKVTGWLARDVSRRVAVTARLDAETWGDIDGSDSDLNPNMVPTADPDLRGGTRVDFGIGLNAMVGGATIGLDLAVPVHQDLDGPQLEIDSIVNASIKAHF